jgi:hypothetical protein
MPPMTAQAPFCMASEIASHSRRQTESCRSRFKGSVYGLIFSCARDQLYREFASSTSSKPCSRQSGAAPGSDRQARQATEELRLFA